MSQRILCYLPAERASLCATVFSTQVIPVIDLCCSDRSRVPNGAWVRTRSKRDIPGKGPVILSGGQHRSPIRGRETWLEVTKPRKVPRGFAGIILRTKETGGWCGENTWAELADKLSKLDPEQTILDVGFTPNEWANWNQKFAGTVVSTQMIGFPEFGLPPALSSLLKNLNATHIIHHNDCSVASQPLSEGLEKLVGGTDWWRVSEGWLREDAPATHLPPWGSAALSASDLASQYGSLSTFLEAFHEASPSVQETIVNASTTGAVTETMVKEVVVEKVIEKVVEKIVEVEIQQTPLPRTIVTPTEHSKEPIAIIGMGCRLPKANSIPELETLLRQGTYAIQEVPKSRWDPELFWDADPKAPDKSYSKIGGFIEDFVFEPKRFRIPPKVAAQIDLVQQLTLMSVADALDDADFTANNTLSNERVGVILGNSMGGESSDDHTVRTRLPEVVHQVVNGNAFGQLSTELQTALLADIEGSKEHLPIITEDTMPGELANVIAGRIANAFDFNGPNYTVDAACASSMAAIQAAVKGLQDGEFDMAITGGADRSMGVPTYVKFSKIGALSADISAPFDERANGFVMGEGCAILVLKRLSDAERDGDRIYATIRGIGASSDGKGKGITAPNPKGQRLALERAYQNAGVPIDSVAYFECHGTSTQVGDKVEATVLAESFNTTEHKPRLGSIKSNIGHLKSAAGAAAVVKGALSLYHKTFYATANVVRPRTDIPLDKLQVQTATEEWISNTIRRVGVSAFGFGGTNFHIVMEEQQPVLLKPALSRKEALPTELTCFSGLSKVDIERHITQFQQTGEAYFNPQDPIRVIISSENNDELASQLTRLIDTLSKGRNPATLQGRGIFYADQSEINFSKSSKAFLFTGQGSQYLNMGMELAARFSVVQKTFDEAEEVFLKEVGVSLKALIQGDPSMTEAEREAQLTDTRIAQPATLAMDIAIARLLRDFGVEADMVAGHSLGEYAACVVAGIMSFTDAIHAVSARGREMAAIHLDDPGKMASVAAGMDKIEPLLAQMKEYVIAANKNCPSQTVIAGSSAGVDSMMALCQEHGIRCQALQVSHAFHSNIVAPAGEPLKKVLQQLTLNTPSIPISTNVTGDWFPHSVPHIIDVLSKQIASPVEWIQQIEGLYAHQARVFIECGPKRALTGLTSTTLKGLPHVSIHTNHPRRGEALSFIDAIGQLVSLGIIDAPSSTRTLSASEKALTKEIADLRSLLHRKSLSVPLPTENNSRIVCTGASLGLPGGQRVFAPDNALSILRGDNRLTAISKGSKTYS